MARNRKSLVKLRGNIYYENFTVNGVRFRACLHTDNKEDAEIIAAKTRSDALLGCLTRKRLEMTLTVALGKDWMENGQYSPDAKQIQFWARALQNKENGLGENTLLSKIARATIIDYRARRLVGHANGTVNNELRYLRRVMNRARGEWKVATAEIEWKGIFLKEREHERELSREEQERLFKELRPDYHALVIFALLTGMRVSTIIWLKWNHVKWSEGCISFRGKGDELHELPITRAIAAILSVEQGRHPVFVFTFIARKSYPTPRTGGRRITGQRYPFCEYPGWNYWWRRAVKKAQLWDNRRSPDRFRFHDLRHTAGTRLLRKTGNLKIVQRLLGHKSIKATARYAHAFTDDLREGMEAEDKAQPRHRAAGMAGKS
jgi:integrase